MDTLTAARAQMEMSLAFHMIFAALGIGMPLLMVISEGLWLRRGQRHYLDLAHKWGKATALTFVVGAVSGTGLSFELGLLWPRFMEFSGPIIGSAFALEGYAFFIEAIFLGLYLYGWDRLSPRAHWLTGIPVAVSGMISGVLVVGANAWMQTPSGFDLVNGKPTNIDPLAPFFNERWPHMAIHSTLSCYIAVGFAVAGVYAVGMLRKGRNDAYHRSAITMSLAVATVTAMLQPISGHFLGENVAHTQPAKLAAFEAHFETERGADLIIGGWPDVEAGRVDYAIRIPGGLSFLATRDFNGEVKGLNDFPEDERPNVLVSHIAFQVMVGSGFALIGIGVLYWLAYWRGMADNRLLLLLLALASPVGFIALEAGWIVTEVGRQPWTIYGVMRTAEAVTPAEDVATTFFVFSALYLGLGLVLVMLLRHLATGAPEVPANKEPVGQEAPYAA